MDKEENIKRAYDLINKGKNLINEGERLLKIEVDKSCRIDETPEPSSTSKKSYLTEEEKQRLMQRLNR